MKTLGRSWITVTAAWFLLGLLGFGSAEGRVVSVQKDWAYTDNPGPDSVLISAEAVVEAADRSVWVLERRRDQVRVFSETGTSLATIGLNDSGGVFPTGLVPTPDSLVGVIRVGVPRVSFYRANGDHVRTVSVAMNGDSNAVALDRVVPVGNGFGMRLFVIDGTTETLETHAVMCLTDSSLAETNRIQDAHASFDAVATGSGTNVLATVANGIFVGGSRLFLAEEPSTYELDVYTGAGSLQTTITRSCTIGPPTIQETAEYLERTAAVRDSIAAYWPGFTFPEYHRQCIAGISERADGKVWVVRQMSNSESASCQCACRADVFSDAGAYVETVDIQVDVFEPGDVVQVLPHAILLIRGIGGKHIDASGGPGSADDILAVTSQDVDVIYCGITE